MKLEKITTVESISPIDFKENYYKPQRPLIIKNLSKDWPAYKKWDWDYLINSVGDKTVGVYNNIKSDAYTPINKADGFMQFGDYLKQIKNGPLDLRIFLFNLFQHAPQLNKDIAWPDDYMTGFIKSYPMLFAGGQGSITHMHFDIDLSNIFHTQFLGRKKVLLFPFEEQHKIYRKPWEVLSHANFANYETDFNYEEFPACRLAKGYEVILEHGDTLFMPSGYWHHMVYLESGVAVSLRALQSQMQGKINGLWNLFGMRSIDTLMKKTFPKWWYNLKIKKVYSNAQRYLQAKD